MNQPSALEFVLVSSDYALMQAVSKAVKKFGAKFVLVPSAHEARDCLNRRKIDGVFVDMEVPGAFGLIESTRRGTSNCKAVIFACLINTKESTQILAVGANFLLRKPVTEDGVGMHITISKDLLLREQRPVFPASCEFARDLEGQGSGATGAHHELERRGNGSSNGEAPETRRRTGLHIRIVHGSAHQRQRPGGLGELGGHGGNHAADAARKRKRTTGRVARVAGATRFQGNHTGSVSRLFARR